MAKGIYFGVNSLAKKVKKMYIGVGGVARQVKVGYFGVNNKAYEIYNNKNFVMPEFSGSHAIFGDENSGRIEIYESGTLKLYPGIYDYFLVGGGGCTRPCYWYISDRNDCEGGAGGGYTKTEKNVNINKTEQMFVYIGAGATQTKTSDGNVSWSPSGGSTSIGSISASGGWTNGYKNDSSEYGLDSGDLAKDYGGDGGSGGGNIPYRNDDIPNGASNGATSQKFEKYDGGYYDGGIGQNTTTRAFEDADGVLYAGGGAGSRASRTGSAGTGGLGGGGNGFSNSGGRATPGTPNTGGGGGGNGVYRSTTKYMGTDGGSGIIIIRWNNI